MTVPARRERPLVEILYFDGCPNHEPALGLVEKVSAELGLKPEIRLVDVADEHAAQRLRFLGSPTIRIDGRDIDPSADTRSDYGLSCRLFHTEAGLVGQPPEQWLRKALLRGLDGSRLAQPDAAVRVLQAANIPPARCGTERARRLSEPEGEFYRWILKAFASGSRPTAAKTACEAARLGLDPAQALKVLAGEDLAHADESGQIVVAYPFSARPRGHRVLIAGQQSVQAMCAVDALGIAPMLEKPIEIASRDPISGAEISVRLDLEGRAVWRPDFAPLSFLAGDAGLRLLRLGAVAMLGAASVAPAPDA